MFPGWPDWAVAVKELLEERRAGQPQPGACVHRPKSGHFIFSNQTTTTRSWSTLTWPLVNLPTIQFGLDSVQQGDILTSRHQEGAHQRLWDPPPRRPRDPLGSENRRLHDEQGGGSNPGWNFFGQIVFRSLFTSFHSWTSWAILEWIGKWFLIFEKLT